MSAGGQGLVGLVLCLAASLAAAQAPLPGWATYRDPQARFAFDFPAAFGTPGRGTNDGFGDRVAAVRFANLPGLGGEVVLTRGPVVLDAQALGGLYDPIALEVFPDAMRRQVVAALPPVTPQSLCQLLAAADHLANAGPLPANVRDAAGRLDRMRNVGPRVARCDVQGGVAVFHKEATFEAPGMSSRQHVFGALRFLDEPGTAVQIVRVLTTPPSAADLEALGRIVRSFARL